MFFHGPPAAERASVPDYLRDFFAFFVLRDVLADFFFFGTFLPALRASERPMAMACFRLVTFLPDRPLFSVPFLRLCIARLTVLAAPLEYFRAINLSVVHNRLRISAENIDMFLMSWSAGYCGDQRLLAVTIQIEAPRGTDCSFRCDVNMVRIEPVAAATLSYGWPSSARLVGPMVRTDLIAASSPRPVAMSRDRSARSIAMSENPASPRMR